MKRYVCLIMALVCVLSFASCSGEKPAIAEDTRPAEVVSAFMDALLTFDSEGIKKNLKNEDVLTENLKQFDLEHMISQREANSGISLGESDKGFKEAMTRVTRMLFDYKVVSTTIKGSTAEVKLTLYVIGKEELDAFDEQTFVYSTFAELGEQLMKEGTISQNSSNLEIMEAISEPFWNRWADALMQATNDADVYAEDVVIQLELVDGNWVISNAEALDTSMFYAVLFD